MRISAKTLVNLCGITLKFFFCESLWNNKTFNFKSLRPSVFTVKKMKHYFSLQFKLQNRQLKDLGIEPILAYVFGILIFFGLSNLCFEKYEFAVYGYLLVALSLIFQLNQTDRNNFLKLCFSKSDFFKVRILENLIISALFVIFLIYKKQYEFSVLLFILICFASFFDFNNKFSFTFPTPFFQHPFEFIVGFRTYFFNIIIAYFLTFMAIYVNNFNLGIFALIVIILTCLQFFTTTENIFYVWIFALTPKQFLRYKFKTIFWFTTILCFPTLLSLCIFFFSKIQIILVFQCLGFWIIGTVMLAKYSVFPNKIDLRLGIVMALTLLLPPILIGITPYLYQQSIQKLKFILNDSN